MQKQQDNKKNLVLVVIIIAVILGAYYMFAKSGDDVNDDALLVAEYQMGPDGTALSDTGMIGQDLLNLLNELESIELDDSIFSNEIFTSFEDYTIEITAQPVGRDNPFAPLPSAKSASAAKIPTINLPRR